MNSIDRATNQTPLLNNTRGASAFAAAVCVTFAVSACGDNKEPESNTVQYQSDEVREPDRDHSIADETAIAAAMAQFSMVELATAEIEPTEGNSAQGTVRFRPSEDKQAMLVQVEITGLSPGKHGFHVHANGDCSSPDASSAGRHFNPYNTDHGSHKSMEHHTGDLGNVEANEDGVVAMEFRADDLAFSGPASILQKSVVIHAKADDLESNPSGKSGDRLGCGVIRQVTEVLAN
tara:strand:+ start:129 stop:830 length:702 start_codon:yes stop_codon:yes gene_type:complete